jgi:hypothetical protein
MNNYGRDLPFVKAGKIGFNDKIQPVPRCPPMGVSIPGKKSRRETAVASKGAVQKQKRMITYIFKGVIYLLPKFWTRVQDFELSGKNHFYLFIQAGYTLTCLKRGL